MVSDDVMKELNMLLKVENLVKLYPIPILGGVAKEINYLLGVDIPRCVKIGKRVHFPHNAIGTVIHDNTVIEDDVKIYQCVTFGRADVYRKGKTEFEGFYVEQGACICAGAKIICKNGTLRIGKGAVVAANAVLLNSIGPGEIWGGVPAKLLGYRQKNEL